MDGFTIIEVMLFLGISSMLLLVVFSLSSTLIVSTRFTDSVRGLESFLQRQYEEVASGVNTRGSEACTSSDTSSRGTSACLLLGRLIVFTANSAAVNSVSVIGSDVTSSGSTMEAVLNDFAPRTAPSTLETYLIPWDARFTSARRTSDSVGVNAVAILRNPKSSQIAYYFFTAPATSTTTGASLTGGLIATGTTSTETNFCVLGQDNVITNTYKAAIKFGMGQGSSAINAVFDGAPC